jgi:hypothetical protein
MLAIEVDRQFVASFSGIILFSLFILEINTKLGVLSYHNPATEFTLHFLIPFPKLEVPKEGSANAGITSFTFFGATIALQLSDGD